MTSLLKFADLVEGVLRRIADAGAWAFVACIVVITFDVVTRKFGFQLPGMGSTRLQELEWHLHAVLFCTWLGYTYLRNGHVRIDVFTGGLAPRSKLWLELFCCVVLRCRTCGWRSPTPGTSSWCRSARTSPRTRRPACRTAG